MDRNVECKCCQEIDAVMATNHEAVEVEQLEGPPECITQHPGFHAVCINIWVLQTAWLQYKQQYDEPYEGPLHKRMRHILPIASLPDGAGVFGEACSGCSAIMCSVMHKSTFSPTW